MAKDSVIFIERPEWEYERLGRGEKESCVRLLLVSPTELPRRIASAFVPPVVGLASRRVYVDFVGPLLAISFLALVLHAGHFSKQSPPSISPSTALATFLLGSPIFVLVGARLGQSRLSSSQVLALLGYSLYGPLLTALSSVVLPNSQNHFFFFLALFLFGGLTALRLAIVLLLTIPRPIARFLICTLVSISHLLFIIFIHFAYMHRTFVYGKKL